MSGFFGFPTELPERRGPSLNHTPLNDNTLDEGDDDFNDETFGGNGAVGQLRFPLSRAWAKRRAQYEVRG